MDQGTGAKLVALAVYFSLFLPRMPKNSSSYYWWCQIGGWSTLALTSILYNAIFEQQVNAKFQEQIGAVIFAGSGLLSTHLFREFIRRSNWLRLPLEKAIPKFFLGVIVVCLTTNLIRIGLDHAFGLYNAKHKVDLLAVILFDTLAIGIVIVPWTLLYYFYHYVEKSRLQQLDTLKLESLVKELELKTIKSHINPHFIFNSLNSIRALVDENPHRARTAITELSNILRSSMQTEKQETVALEKELDIVQDYLALEHIRFEDRLMVEYQIDAATLTQPVPPMMLQTLVENAIKHGISKQVHGGVVYIGSDFRDDYHELVIRNTGHLHGSLNGEGFGLVSTRNRLHLLFGPRANFEIRQLNANLVEAVVRIPVVLSK